MNFKQKYCRNNYSHYSNSNILGKFVFWWLIPIIKYTKKKPFEQELHYNLPEKYKIKNSNKKFYKCLKNNKNNLIKGIFEFVDNKLILFIILSVMAFINFFNVFLFIQINDITTSIKNDSEIPNALKKVGYYCIGLLLIEFLVTSSYVHLEYYFTKLSLLVKNNTIYLIIKKTWKLSQKGLNETSDGNIINLIQVDSQKIEDNMNFFFYGTFTIVNSTISLIYTFVFVGWIMILYILAFCIILFWMKYLININYKYEKNIRKIKDNTSSLWKNVFYNIKYIKFNVYENYITKKIFTQKLKEINILYKRSIVIGIIIFLNWFNPKISFFILVISFKLTKRSIKIIFPLLRIIQQVENLFIFLPYLIQFYFEMKVTFKRIQKFLDIKEENIKHITNVEDNTKSNVSLSVRGSFIWSEKKGKKKNKKKDKIKKRKSKKSKNIVIEKLEDNDDNKNDDSNKINFKLKNLDVEFEKESLTFIIGKIGSGKTSLFYTILGELEKEENNKNCKIIVDGKISCSPQNYFLQSRSIKNNILFYDKNDETKLNNVIELCFLKEDFELLEKGVDTEIGDQGINISGGQKARISLARSLYKNREILILDDPIGALDTETATNIMKNTLIEKLKDKTRIIITHSIQFLNYANNIIFMDDGEIKYKGLKDDFINTDYYKILVKDMDKEKQNNNIDERKKSKKIEEKIINIDKKDKDYEVANKFILDEDKVNSRNLFKTLLLFFKKLGGVWIFLVILLLTLGFTSSIFISTTYIENYCKNNTEITKNFINVLLLIMIVPTIICGIRAFFIFFLVANLSKKLHNEMIFRVLHAKIGEFLDRIPIGRLLNRFTKDIYNIEKSLSSYFSYILIKLCQTIIVYFAVIYSSKNAFSILVVIVFAVYCFYVQHYYIKVSKDATRLESITKTPILNLTTEIVKGTFLFKSFNKKKDVKIELKNFIDENTKNGLLIGGMLGWFQMRIGLSNVFIIQLCSYLILIFSKNVTKETFYNLNLSIFFILQMIENTIEFLNSFSTLENNLVSVERCNAFNEIPIEKNYLNYNNELNKYMKNIEKLKEKDLIEKKINKSNDINLSKYEIDYNQINNLFYKKRLFKNGNIIFEKVSAKYPTKTNNVLNKISFEIKPNEKIGIIGRTGAGKSSIIKILSRYLINNEGTIKIDGYDISKLDLKKLRSEVFVLNQDISIFEGTLLENIDISLIGNKKNKNKKINDLQESLLNNDELKNKIKLILEILEKMGFSKEKLKKGIYYKIESEGKNLSQGEKQLISFVRAIFSDSKIWIFDEATANIDIETEKWMFETIHQYMQNKTVIMIAHRLTTLLKCDKILTLSKGTIEDFRSLEDLLNDENSYFKQMLNKYKKINK